ncbi:Phosphoglucomutase-2, putative [Perkinsus marinus ATCC 50983]|uniref:Phosphoglucomutase-2, putative n=1 Tax=Perkinsus marinus (strain ATCC 50983 / TXsc) TaxID=423536 RepID=C5LAW0_PERM5|nr:Phosphoglucomutase-2, putative [Perkinsus marinus ATCC 50983]EER06129.1 Phosphoglucomutase-2, putative [Perkinsus marinus ATCC 50983]|eukprot:XP_002774313.1 Phosphoglucomutase-2, putative [Perkinsus marinus ATCC 50983]
MTKSAVELWCEQDPDGDTIKEAQSLDDQAVAARLDPNHRLQFGTAGLRGVMGAGYDRMNCLTVMQASQGLCMHCIEKYGQQALSERGVVFGFDGRHKSRAFAHVASAVFLSKGAKVYLIDKTSITPSNPFLIVRFQALCGGQMTASHNPKEYNGYKVYGANGAQIIPPADSEIQANIMANLKPWPEALQLLGPDCLLKDKSKTVDPYDVVLYTYIDQIHHELCRFPELNKKCELKFVYTAMQGVGLPFALGMLKIFGFPETCVSVVEQQAHPDPEFSTVAFPNPEEKGALDMSMAQAQRENADYVLANDPDADRYTSCEKQKDGSWHQFTGDELGTIFADWQLLMAHRRGVPKENCLVINSTVSSKMVKALSDYYGGVYVDTLTGFKWMANQSLKMISENPKLVHCTAYEEALGSALTMTVPDKDGVSACAVWCEMANYWRREKGITLVERLNELREMVGYFVQHNGYFISTDPKVTKQVFDDFRNNGQYKDHLGASNIAGIRDVTLGYDSRTPDKKSTLPQTPNDQMITLYFENGATVTIRGSGTEPKVKYYCEASDKKGMKEAQQRLDGVVKDVIDHFLQPGKFGLTSR